MISLECETVGVMVGLDLKLIDFDPNPGVN
jgi:hypothetical protein